MDIVLIYMSFVSKLAGHFGQKSGLIGHWPADIHGPRVGPGMSSTVSYPQYGILKITVLVVRD